MNTEEQYKNICYRIINLAEKNSDLKFLMNAVLNERLKLFNRITAYMNSIHTWEKCEVIVYYNKVYEKSMFYLTISCATKLKCEAQYRKIGSASYTYEQLLNYFIEYNSMDGNLTFFKYGMLPEEIELQLAIRGF